MDLVPLIPAGQSASYFLDPNVIYQFKLSHGPLGTRARADLALKFDVVGSGPNQSFRAYALSTPVKGPGTSTFLGAFPFGVATGTKLADGVTAFAGPRADPFFFDLFQFFSITRTRARATRSEPRRRRSTASRAVPSPVRLPVTTRAAPCPRPTR
jgi:hypothetical protein